MTETLELVSKTHTHENLKHMQVDESLPQLCSHKITLVHMEQNRVCGDSPMRL